MHDIDTILPCLKLYLAIKHPSVEECYHAGYEAAEALCGLESNPFMANKKNHHHWDAGWWDGFYQADMLFKPFNLKNEPDYPADYTQLVHSGFDAKTSSLPYLR